MALVFVHGVNVRYDPNSDPYVAARDALFRKSVLPKIVAEPTKSLIVNPYWGADAAKFPWNHGGLPEGKYEKFGSVNLDASAVIDDLISAGLLDVEKPDSMGGIDPDQVLLTLARISLATAVDRLWVVASKSVEQRNGASHAELSMAVATYVIANPHPSWLDSVQNDKEFVSKLLRAVAAGVSEAGTSEETFGMDEVRGTIRNAAESIRDGFVELLTSAKRAADEIKAEARSWLDDTVLSVRTPIHKSVATFLGDVFVYFRQREQGSTRNAIASTVTDALEAAAANRNQTGEPIIVVAHSMGGNIVYDLLTSSKKDLTVDTLVTVGSQVAVIEEMKLFASSDPTIPNENVRKVSRPRNVNRWINVFDSTDILGFAAGRVFEGVVDYHFVTGRAWAHGGYFVEPMFHERLGRRLGEKV